MFIVLLRGINVGGNKRIKMADLKVLFESIGFSSVQTLLQSGNVILESEISDSTALAHQLEAVIQKHFGFESKIILRTADQWKDVILRHPFSAEQLSEPSKILVTFLRDSPTPESIAALMSAHTGIEQLYVSGHECYGYFPEGLGRTKLDNGLIERKLKTMGTGRNWNTVSKLLALTETPPNRCRLVF